MWFEVRNLASDVDPYLYLWGAFGFDSRLPTQNGRKIIPQRRVVGERATVGPAAERSTESSFFVILIFLFILLFPFAPRPHHFGQHPVAQPRREMAGGDQHAEVAREDDVGGSAVDHFQNRVGDDLWVQALEFGSAAGRRGGCREVVRGDAVVVPVPGVVAADRAGGDQADVDVVVGPLEA